MHGLKYTGQLLRWVNRLRGISSYWVMAQNAISNPSVCYPSPEEYGYAH